VTTGRERLVAVLLLVALGGAAVLTSTQAWVEVTLPSDRPITVAGSAAVPAIAPLGLVLLALAATLGIAARGARILLAAVTALVGLALVALGLAVLRDPVAAAAGPVTAATGIAGTASVRAAVGAAIPTGWPVVALVTGVLTAITGVLLAVRSRRWPSGGRRYRPAAPRVATTDPIEEWDALSAGDDPTAGGGGDGARP
jgi:uncharacterized membrane protein (TIGR02234 family)